MLPGLFLLTPGTQASAITQAKVTPMLTYRIQVLSNTQSLMDWTNMMTAMMPPVTTS